MRERPLEKGECPEFDGGPNIMKENAAGFMDLSRKNCSSRCASSTTLNGR